MAKRKRDPAAGTSKVLDCIYCFVSCRVDGLTRRVICGRCVAEGAPLDFSRSQS